MRKLKTVFLILALALGISACSNDSKCLVLFYENIETKYQYMPLGKVSDTAGLKEALGALILNLRTRKWI